MPSWSRRRALHALASGATVALAGCNGASDVEHVSADARGTPVTDYEVTTVRDPTGDPLVRAADPATDTAAGSQQPTDEQYPPDVAARRARNYARVVTSEAELAEFEFAPDNDHAGALREVVETTDYETRSVSLHVTGVPACYVLRLVGVHRRDDGFVESYCRTLRPADVACDADATHTVGFAIRLPFPADDLNSHGTSIRGDCRGRPHPLTPPRDEAAPAGTARSATPADQRGDGQ